MRTGRVVAERPPLSALSARTRAQLDLLDPTVRRLLDSYSGYFDNGHRKATGLGPFLKESKVTDVYVMGLATDYCVKWTALDAVKLGFRVHLVLDGCRGVGLTASDVPNAVEEMRSAGVQVVEAQALVDERA